MILGLHRCGYGLQLLKVVAMKDRVNVGFLGKVNGSFFMIAVDFNA